MNDDIFEAGHKLPLMEQFYTVQGEGFHTGSPAYFLRVGGCDIGCSWCDSKLSWLADQHPLVEIDQILKNALEAGAENLVVTGGEPSLYDLSFLTREFKNAGFKLFLETSGAYSLTGQWDWICLSPKKQNPPKKEYLEQAGELKVIIQNPEDLDWAAENAALVKPSCHLFLQPEWSMREQIIPLLVKYVKANKQWRISLQSHKYIGIP
ncbi:MAG: 7-carboxy-7-deazaguanine synthase QueE [Bacteroidales bacterium]|nr:7-carboxy-7-deazaguanine synthase QueE [Bacteroidales bacterium]